MIALHRSATLYPVPPAAPASSEAIAGVAAAASSSSQAFGAASTMPPRHPVRYSSLEMSAMPAATASDSTRLRYVELPDDIWGEIAQYASHQQKLALRSASPALKHQVDRTFTQMAVRGPEKLRAFAQARSLHRVKLLRVHEADDASLRHFAMGMLRAQQQNADTSASGNAIDHRNGPWLSLMSSKGELCDMAYLHHLPLRGMSLRSVQLSAEALASLASIPFPIEISGHFTQTAFTRLADIAMLTRLTSLCTNFTGEVARLFRTHGALRELHLHALPTCSSECIEGIASMPSLRVLSLRNANCIARPISVTAARTLAAHASLERLDIALSGTTPQRRFTRFPFNSPFNLTGLPRPMFAPGALDALVSTTAHTLRIANGTLDRETVDALLGNATLRALSVQGVRIQPSDADRLKAHPALKFLSVHDHLGMRILFVANNLSHGRHGSPSAESAR